MILPNMDRVKVINRYGALKASALEKLPAVFLLLVYHPRNNTSSVKYFKITLFGDIKGSENCNLRYNTLISFHSLCY